MNSDELCELLLSEEYNGASRSAKVNTTKIGMSAQQYLLLHLKV